MSGSRSARYTWPVYNGQMPGPSDEQSARLLEAAAFLLEGAGGVLNTTPLIKALFYLDLVVMLDSGLPATRATYLALGQGPVIAKYPTRLIGALAREELAIQSDQDDGTKPVSLLRAPDAPRFLSAEHCVLAKKIAQWAKTQGAVKLSSFSHQNVGWQIAWSNGLGGSGPARSIDLRVAMQQIGEDDPWLSEQPSAAERHAFEHSDTQPGAVW